MTIWACPVCGLALGREPEKDELVICPNCATQGVLKFTPQEAENMQRWFKARQGSEKGA